MNIHVCLLVSFLNVRILLQTSQHSVKRSVISQLAARILANSQISVKRVLNGGEGREFKSHFPAQPYKDVMSNRNERD